MTRFAGQVKEFDPEQYGINRKEARKMDLSSSSTAWRRDRGAR
ncbi:hypothetical protein ACLK16_05725 [Escherichia coli]